ncbi:hypothetical protein [Jannaschia rubra]|uniref:Uncharacterized protein n=1 Tax=Jannaschia rubra TaxID=282197 RepID=A0A0M6XVD7_9RHOB|nr:hypothetical protein [Jannaschia rubra]CTQ33914.1 hypothetical protein JAN5088_02703 [Jannaschia rubra]SFG76098.1 hypothetical protein SAMN04488517_11416 [Jannaschia rubra]
MEAPERPTPELPRLTYARTQLLADALVEEAVADLPPLPGLTMRANVARLLAAMYYVHGSVKFPRGWVRPAMRAFIDAGVDCSNARCWHSYRSDVQDNPGQFLNTEGAPVEFLMQMEIDLLGDDAASA